MVQDVVSWMSEGSRRVGRLKPTWGTAMKEGGGDESEGFGDVAETRS